jgi:hypothetical protein
MSTTQFALLTAQQLSATYGYDLDLCEAFLATYREDKAEPTEEGLRGFVRFCLSRTEDTEPAADTYFECPPPSADELAEDSGYDLPLCRAYLSSCLDQPRPVEPTEQGLHAFALDYLQAEDESREERREQQAREDRS